MARADIPETNGAAADALGLLTRDHRLVAQLFKEFDVAGQQQLDPLVRRICKMLRIHAQIEEEIFYPAARRVLGDEALIDTAERAHAQAKQSIMLIESMTSEDDAFRAAVSTLAAEIHAHVAEEESELFPKLRQSKMDLASLGLNLVERRDTLMDVLGLHADDEEAAVYPEENPAVAIATAERQQREG
jgi:hemerythrin superfamily protein